MIRNALAVLLTGMLLFAAGCADAPAQQQATAANEATAASETTTAAIETTAGPFAPTEASAVETESQESEAPTAPEELPGPQLPHRFADRAEGIDALRYPEAEIIQKIFFGL